MSPDCKDDHPDEGHDEAEDGDKHHPSQRVLWGHIGRCHQNPNQTTEHLQGSSREILVYQDEKFNAVWKKNTNAKMLYWLQNTLTVLYFFKNLYWIVLIIKATIHRFMFTIFYFA